MEPLCWRVLPSLADALGTHLPAILAVCWFLHFEASGRLAEAAWYTPCGAGEGSNLNRTERTSIFSYASTNLFYPDRDSYL